MSTYAHMCRDGHAEIGFNDGESEVCILCNALAENAALREALRKIVWLDEPPSIESVLATVMRLVAVLEDGGSADLKDIRMADVISLTTDMRARAAELYRLQSRAVPPTTES